MLQLIPTLLFALALKTVRCLCHLWHHGQIIETLNARSHKVITVEPPLSDHLKCQSLGGCHRELVAYAIFDHIRSTFCLINICNCIDLPNCLIRWKVNFEQNPILPIEKFPSLVLPRNTIMLQNLIIQFPLYYLSSSRLREVKTKGKIRTFGLKVVPIVYERWSLIKGPKCSALTGR